MLRLFVDGINGCAPLCRELHYFHADSRRHLAIQKAYPPAKLTQLTFYFMPIFHFSRDSVLLHDDEMRLYAEHANTYHIRRGGPSTFFHYALFSLRADICHAAGSILRRRYFERSLLEKDAERVLLLAFDLCSIFQDGYDACLFTQLN